MSKKVILLMNLGSPNSTKVSDVKDYLNEFLMDQYVIDLPFWIRLFLVKLIIVPFRASKSAHKYETIWTENGSPLKVITSELSKLVEKVTKTPTYSCMRYASPSTFEIVNKIIEEHSDLKEITFMPLYPHYAMSSYLTSVEHITSIKNKLIPKINLKIIAPFYNNEKYINALAESIKPYLKSDYDHILFSYHGIPERHVKKTDPTKKHCLMTDNCCNKPCLAHDYCYRKQTIDTTNLVAQQLNIPSDQYSFSFQSRLGKDKWLLPFTSKVLEEMPKKGIKKLMIICPSFVSDCLETLEEIDIEGRAIFMSSGGHTFDLVPCLNTNPNWVETIASLTENP